MGTLLLEVAAWRDTENYALDIRDRFTRRVNADAELREHRDYVETHAYGMGERCFHWLWRLVVGEMPESFRFMEIGVWKGQVLSLVRLLANRIGKKVDVTGVTVLSPFAGVTGQFPKYANEDYMKHITDLHDHFGLEHPRLIVGDSTSRGVQDQASWHEPLDLLYVDGCHEYEYVAKDLIYYPQLLRVGGLLVVDDAACYLEHPAGFFSGIEPVSRAVRTVIETDPQWQHLLAVVHNRVFRRIA